MVSVEVEITAVVDTAFPGFVEFELVDARGSRHAFVDKAPIVVSERTVGSLELPCRGHLRCQVVERHRDTVVIGTSAPDSVESTTGQTRFAVLTSGGPFSGLEPLHATFKAG